MEHAYRVVAAEEPHVRPEKGMSRLEPTRTLEAQPLLHLRFNLALVFRDDGVNNLACPEGAEALLVFGDPTEQAGAVAGADLAGARHHVAHRWRLPTEASGKRQGGGAVTEYRMVLITHEVIRRVLPVIGDDPFIGADELDTAITTVEQHVHVVPHIPHAGLKTGRVLSPGSEDEAGVGVEVCDLDQSQRVDVELAVVGLQEAYYGELDVDSLGLVEVAHLATWAEDAPTLEAYLGDMRYYLDIRFNRRDGGVELIGPDKWIIHNNWKNSADNFIGDAYHAPISHRSASLARLQVKNLAIPRTKPFESPGGNQVNPGNGHGQQVFHFDTEEDFRRRQFQQEPVLAEYEESLIPEMERRLGFVRARRMRTAHNTVFPNFSSLTGPRPTRIWHPRGPLKTEVWAFWCLDKEAPEEVKQLYRTTGMQSFGPSGMAEQDDMDNWRGSTEAGRSSIARQYPAHIGMGVGHEWTNPAVPGRSIPNSFAEINQRAMYVRWQEFMNAESWADVRVDPITAQFEGSATMKG